MNERGEGMLGLCARARKLITGEKAVVQAVRAGSCRLAILDGGVAKNGEEAVAQACQVHGVPLLRTRPGQLGRAIGKEGQNARLAAKLTGWKIDIKSQSQVEAAAAAATEAEEQVEAEPAPAVEDEL